MTIFVKISDDTLLSRIGAASSTQSPKDDLTCEAVTVRLLLKDISRQVSKSAKSLTYNPAFGSFTRKSHKMEKNVDAYGKVCGFCG